MKSKKTIFLYAFKVWLAAVIGGSFLATFFSVAQYGSTGVYSFVLFFLESAMFSVPVLFGLCLSFLLFAYFFKELKQKRIFAMVFTMVCCLLFVFALYFQHKSNHLSIILTVDEIIPLLFTFPLAGGIAAWFMFPKNDGLLEKKQENFDILDEF